MPTATFTATFPTGTGFGTAGGFGTGTGFGSSPTGALSSGGDNSNVSNAVAKSVGIVVVSEKSNGSNLRCSLLAAFRELLVASH